MLRPVGGAPVASVGLKPYYQDDLVTLYNGDAREILPQLPNNSADFLMTEPPYGVGKAPWDKAFPMWWFDDAARIAHTLGLMPGIWNFGVCPPQIGRLQYRWTLAAHEINGRTRGALGLADWIPCMVYMADETPAWCVRFADWCRDEGITSKDLNRATDTSMGSHWWARPPATQPSIPAAHQWDKICAKYDPPEELDPWVYADDPFANRGSTSKMFKIGKVPMQPHPCPKPLDITAWFLSRLPGYRLGRGVVDPFAGSGTTLLAARDAGMPVVGIELEEQYCEVIARRLSAPAVATMAAEEAS